MSDLCFGSQPGGGRTCSDVMLTSRVTYDCYLPSVPSPDSVLVNRLDIACSYFCHWDVVITITIISLLDVTSSCPVSPFGLSSSCLHIASEKVLVPNSIDAVVI